MVASNPRENYGNRPHPAVIANGYDKNFPNRIREVDRSDIELVKNTNIRNIRTSNMPGNPKNQAGNPIPTTDESFNQKYATAGIQPTLATNNKIGDKSERQDTTRGNAKVEYSNQASLNQNKFSLLNKKNEKGMLGGNKFKVDLIRKKAWSTNVGIWSANGAGWFFIQLPFALFANIFIGLQYGLETLADNLTTITADDGFFMSGVKYLFKGVKSVVEAGAWLVEKITGFDISLIEPGTIGFFFHFMTFIYGFFVLFSIFFVYKLAFLNPLFGRGSNLKTGMFLLAMIGYFLPIANLLPWFLPWTIAVLKNPK